MTLQCGICHGNGYTMSIYTKSVVKFVLGYYTVCIPCTSLRLAPRCLISLFALSLPTEVIIILLFIDDVLSCDFDIFQIFVGVGMRAQLVGKHVVANYSLLLIVVFWPP